MNNTFNAKRFWLLLKKTLLERPVKIFGFTGLLLLLVLIMYSFIKSFGGFNAAQNSTFIWGLAGGGVFLASFVFGYFSSNASGSSFLTLPASITEKWLCGSLITGLLYPVIFLVFYRIMDSSFVALYHNSLDRSSPFYRQLYDSVFVFNFDGIIAWKVYALFFFLTGAMLLGSLYFNKAAIIKTAIVLCVICLLIYGANWLFATILFGHVDEAALFYNVAIPVGNEIGSIELPADVAKIYKYAFLYGMPACFWLLSFIRLREKEF